MTQAVSGGKPRQNSTRHNHYTDLRVGLVRAGVGVNRQTAWPTRRADKFLSISPCGTSLGPDNIVCDMRTLLM